MLGFAVGVIFGIIVGVGATLIGVARGEITCQKK